MDPKEARLIGDRWYEAAEEVGGPKDLYRNLSRELGTLLSDGAQTGIGSLDGATVVLAVDGERFLCVGVEKEEGENEPVVSVRSVSLSGDPDLDVSSRHLEERNTFFLERTWTLATRSGGTVVVVTHLPLSKSFAVDRGGEALMRAVARKLGWPAPTS